MAHETAASQTHFSDSKRPQAYHPGGRFTRTRWSAWTSPREWRDRRPSAPQKHAAGCINRLKRRRGRIVVDNIPQPPKKSQGAPSGMVFQSFNLFPDKTALATYPARIVRKRRRPRPKPSARPAGESRHPGKKPTLSRPAFRRAQHRGAMRRAGDGPKIMLFETARRSTHMIKKCWTCVPCARRNDDGCRLARIGLRGRRR